MTLSIAYSQPFVATGVMSCIRSRISTYLAAIVAAANGNPACPSSMAGYQVQFGDDRMPQPAADWIRVQVGQTKQVPTAHAEESIAVYSVVIEALSVEQEYAQTPSAIPGGDPTFDADTTVMTSTSIRVMAIAEAAAQSLERHHTADVNGAYSIVRVGSTPFVPKEKVAFGYRITHELTCRSTWPQGA